MRYLFVLISVAMLIPHGQAHGQAAAKQMKIKILSATVKDKAIANAELIFQKAGFSSVIAKTNANGDIDITAPFNGGDDDSVTIIVKKTGYSNLIAKCPCNGLTYAMSPVMKNLDGLRVVLNWGKLPKDIDSHLSFLSSHVNYHKQQGTNAHLDVDDTNGYGPETITIVKKIKKQKYVYAIHNYSDLRNRDSTQLSSLSDAKVFVYTGKSLIHTYKVPPEKKGNLWIIFKIDEQGDIHKVDTFSYASSWEEVGHKLQAFRMRLQIMDGHCIKGSTNCANPMLPEITKLISNAGFSAIETVPAKNKRHKMEVWYKPGMRESAEYLVKSQLNKWVTGVKKWTWGGNFDVLVIVPTQ